MGSVIRRLALAGICLAVLAVAARYGSYVAGGSDSYCYIHQAERWASGRLLVIEPLALEAPWPEAPLTFAPAGHRPSSTVPGALVPICTSGFSMLLALFLLAGGPVAMFSVVPLCGVLLVVATHAVGSRISPAVGLASALVTASSPVVLYQLIQPMSDVPAAAFWMLAVACATSARRLDLAPARRGGLAAGIFAGVAILVRPNLVPLGFVVGLYLLWQPGLAWRQRLAAGTVYALGCAVGCVAVGAIQQYFYGSPFASGYGQAGDLFSMTRVASNLSRYAAWLIEVQTPLVLLAAAAPFVLAGPLTALCAAFVLVNLALYLPYLEFDDWSYVRFLLPSIPVLIVLMLGALDALVRRAGERWAAAALALTALALVALAIPVAAKKQVFRLSSLESDFARVGDAVARSLPANALVITSRYSGSVRYYAGRKTLVWDVLDPAWLERSVAFAKSKSLAPYLIVASGEEQAFRQRFGMSTMARLDWPPRLEIAPQVRVYAPDDRETYLRGEPVPTAYVR